MENSETSVRVIDVEVVCKTLSLHQRLVGDVSCVVWDAAIVLSKYLQLLNNENGDNLMPGSRILELGSGVGCVGLTAATLGAEVTLTDLPEALPLLRHNITENKTTILSCGGYADAQILTWGDIDSDIINEMSFDYVLLADCVYYKESIDPLIKTLVNINRSSNKKAQIYITQEMRDSDNLKKFWTAFHTELNKYFDVVEIPRSQQHPEYSSDDILLLQCSKKNTEHTIL